MDLGWSGSGVDKQGVTMVIWAYCKKKGDSVWEWWHGIKWECTTCTQNPFFVFELSTTTRQKCHFCDDDECEKEGPTLEPFTTFSLKTFFEHSVDAKREK